MRLEELQQVLSPIWGIQRILQAGLGAAVGVMVPACGAVRLIENAYQKAATAYPLGGTDPDRSLEQASK